MSVSYEDNNNKEFTNSPPVEGRRKPTATLILFQAHEKTLSKQAWSIEERVAVKSVMGKLTRQGKLPGKTECRKLME